MLQRVGAVASVVSLAWPVQTAGKGVDAKRHCILKTVHPSPLSAMRGFIGCKHFSKTNDFLTSKGLPPIDWNIV